MADELDVLFCKVALHNKLVTKEQAQACLAEATEAGRDVGEILQEKLLLTAAQANQIWNAVERVQEGGGGAPAPAPAKRPRAAAPRGRARPPAREGRARRRPPEPPPDEPPPRRGQRQDPARLAVTIGSMVILVGILIALVIVMKPFSSTERSAVSEVEEGIERRKPSAPKKTGLSKGATPGGSGAPANVQLSASDKAEMDRVVNMALADARANMRDDRHQDAMGNIGNVLTSHAGAIDAENRKKLEELRQDIRARIAERQAEAETEITQLLAEGNKSEASDVIDASGLWSNPDWRKAMRDKISGGG